MGAIFISYSYKKLIYTFSHLKRLRTAMRSKAVQG